MTIDRNALHEGSHVPGLVAASSANDGTLVALQGDPNTGRLLVQGASFLSQLLTATGTVNGVNTAFTFTEEPNFIVSDGSWYQATDNTGATNWTWNSGLLQATMTVPPSSAIWGFL